MTERSALKTKYFYTEENRDAFREEYEAVPLYEKAMENTPLAAGAAAAAVLVLLGVLISIGGLL